MEGNSLKKGNPSMLATVLTHFSVPSADKDELLYAWAEVVARVLLNHSSGPSRSIFGHDCESELLSLSLRNPQFSSNHGQT